MRCLLSTTSNEVAGPCAAADCSGGDAGPCRRRHAAVAPVTAVAAGERVRRCGAASVKMNALQTATTVIASVALALFALAEVLLAMPVAWWLYLSLIPLFAAGLLRRQPGAAQFLRLVALIVIVAGMAALYFVPWSSRKPFLRDLNSIRPGMSEAEVRRIMGRYLEGTGWPAPYGGTPDGRGTLNILGSGATHATGTSPNGQMTIADSLVFRHSNDGAFNSDWGIVTLKDGKVTAVSFSPD